MLRSFWNIALLAACAPAIADPIAVGAYISKQLNVDQNGQNIPGASANEASIAINPLNPLYFLATWHQTTSSRFRAVESSYTLDGGSTWSSPQVLNPGQSYSNGTVDVDSAGNFYYQGLNLTVNNIDLIKSVTGGMDWLAPVNAGGVGADKGEMAVDRSGLQSDGHIYIHWASGNDDNRFSRSIDAGGSFQTATAIPDDPSFGSVKVGVNGEVYVVGRFEPGAYDENSNTNRYQNLFSTALNAAVPGVLPVFTTQIVDLGGYTIMPLFYANPNRYGPLGDLRLGIDHSMNSSRGNIYILGSVVPYNSIDPQDIHLLRSTDGGQTWSTPIKVNDDPANPNAWQWFSMLGVAPNSRLDAVWYDTRDSKAPRTSALYYAYSWDGGVTWSKNIPVTPRFSTWVANPGGQTKIGDYTNMASGSEFAHIVYTGTFNGKEDIYYLAVFPDCNNNQVSDLIDIQQGAVSDSNSDHIPDICQHKGDINHDLAIDQFDLNQLLAANNQPAYGKADPRDLDQNGVINVLDARKLVLLCTRPHCATSN